MTGNLRFLFRIGLFLSISAVGSAQPPPATWTDWKPDPVFSGIEWRGSCTGLNEFAKRHQIDLELRNNYPKEVRVSSTLGDTPIDDLVIGQGRVAITRAFVAENCESKTFSLRIGNVAGAGPPTNEPTRVSSPAPASQPDILGTWEYVYKGEGVRDGTIKFVANVREMVRLELAGATIRGSYLSRTSARQQSGAFMYDDRVRMEFELSPSAAFRGFIAKLTSGTFEGAGEPSRAARIVACSRCASWDGPVGSTQVVGNLGSGNDGRLGLELFYDTSPHLMSVPGGAFTWFEKARSTAAFEEFLASDFRAPRTAVSQMAVTLPAASDEGVEVNQSASKGDLKHARETFTQANLAFATGNCQKATPLYVAYLAMPGRFRIFEDAIHTALGDCYEKLGRSREALEESKKVISDLENPKTPLTRPSLKAQASYELGVAYERLGDTDRAITKFEESIDASPILPSDFPVEDVPLRDAFARLAAVFEKVGRNNEAALFHKESAIHAEARKAAVPFEKRGQSEKAYAARIAVYNQSGRPLYAQAVSQGLGQYMSYGTSGDPGPSVTQTILGAVADGLAQMAQTRAQGQATVTAAREQAGAQRAQRAAAQAGTDSGNTPTSAPPGAPAGCSEYLSKSANGSYCWDPEGKCSPSDEKCIRCLTAIKASYPLCSSGRLAGPSAQTNVGQAQGAAASQQQAQQAAQQAAAQQQADRVRQDLTHATWRPSVASLDPQRPETLTFNLISPGGVNVAIMRVALSGGVIEKGEWKNGSLWAEVSNGGSCELLYDGGLYVNGTPIKFLAGLGVGRLVKNQSSRGQGAVEIRLGSAITFKPSIPVLTNCQ